MGNLIKGSVGYVAKERSIPLPAVLSAVEVVILVDTSGSMGGDKIRHARKAMEDIQGRNSGKCGIIHFGSTAEWLFHGILPAAGGSTNLAKALSLAKDMDGLVKYIVISDGYPDNPDRALAIAKTYSSQIDTIFIGDDRDTAGKNFLLSLSRVSSGRSLGVRDVANLSSDVQRLLTM